MSDHSSEAKLLIFQAGPVQKWIAQARTTRDLWSGSYLLSWLVAHLVRRLRDGGADLVFPSLKSEDGENRRALLTFLDRHKGGKPCGEALRKQALVPNFPNRVVALAPPDAEAEFAGMVEGVFSGKVDNSGEANSVWGCIAARSLRFLEPHPPAPETRPLWNYQIQHHWQTQWAFFENRGHPWADWFRESTRAFDGRRQTREFASWEGLIRKREDESDAPELHRNFDGWEVLSDRNKDFFSGRQEVVIDRQWLETLREASHSDPEQEAKREKLCHLFRKDDQLGAPGVIKRVWHRAYLEEKMKFSREDFNMPSTPGIAAFPWVADLAKENAELETELENFVKGLEDIRQDLDFELPDLNKPEALKRVDWEVFQSGLWENQIKSARKRGIEVDRENGLEAKREALRQFKAKHRDDAGEPGRYYAALAMDGDSIGRWLSGDMSEAPGLTREYHRNFSEGMLSTAESLIQATIEHEWEPDPTETHPFQGKLIYAGGDDVLALMPAGQALSCAEILRRRFVEAMEKAAGLDSDLISASVGIALGYFKSPLQDMVREAQEALKLAKSGRFSEPLDDGRRAKDAVCVKLFRRSGAQTVWGAQFKSPTLELMHFLRGQPDGGAPRFRRRYGKAEPPISSRFPHRLAALLEPYERGKATAGENGEESVHARAGAAWKDGKLRKVVLAETRWAIDQHVAEEARSDLFDHCEATLAYLEQHSLPLTDFINAFLVEAFIAGKEED